MEGPEINYWIIFLFNFDSIFSIISMFVVI
mgnify:CR=1